jgi:hypothetical protein
VGLGLFRSRVLNSGLPSTPLPVSARVPPALPTETSYRDCELGALSGSDHTTRSAPELATVASLDREIEELDGRSRSRERSSRSKTPYRLRSPKRPPKHAETSSKSVGPWFESRRAHSVPLSYADLAWLSETGVPEMPGMCAACPHRCPHGVGPSHAASEVAGSTAAGRARRRAPGSRARDHRTARAYTCPL